VLRLGPAAPRPTGGAGAGAGARLVAGRDGEQAVRAVAVERQAGDRLLEAVRGQAHAAGRVPQAHLRARRARARLSGPEVDTDMAFKKVIIPPCGRVSRPLAFVNESHRHRELGLSLAAAQRRAERAASPRQHSR